MSEDARSDDGRNEHDPSSSGTLPVRAGDRREPTSMEPLRLLAFNPRADEAFGPEADFVRASTPAPRDWRRFRAAASLAAVVIVGGAAAAAHVHGLRVANAEEAQARALSHRMEAMSARLESLEANRSRDDVANIRKVISEIRAGAASTRDVGGSVAQLSARVDRLEKDQGPRLEKLGDRIDHDSATRLSDLATRLDKLETKTAAATAAAAKTVAVAVAAATPPAPTPPAKASVVAKASPGVSTEPTGSIDRVHARLRGFYLSEIHNGYAMIDSPAGEFAVAPGDMMPGGGRVLRIERHGRDWVVVTTQGQILASD
jgi:hypothetical protein